MIDSPAQMRARVALLTPRHRAIMRLICDGGRMEKVAEALGITFETARGHARTLKAILRADTIAHAAAIFVQGGGLDGGDDADDR